jgi:branched-chain amino acid transport system permease protein
MVSTTHTAPLPAAAPSRGWSRAALAAGVLLALAWPWLMAALDEPFYVSLATRILIFGLVVSSLNLVLGYGGMVSFGHAAYLGLGAYTVGILSLEAARPAGLLPGTTSAWIAWPAAMGVSALAALVFGAISLRTRGIYFIMITLAFAQMLYYVMVSLKVYGGDDGLNLAARSQLGFGLDLGHDTTFYYVVLAAFAGTLYALHRITASRFGRAIRGIRENQARMQAIGYDTWRLQLACFVISGAFAGLGGALLANQNTFVSPNLLSWFQSGSLLMMLILGGVGYLWGGPLGALAFLVLEEVLSGWTQRWQFVMGALLVLIVLYAPRGLAGLFGRRSGS